MTEEPVRWLFAHLADDTWCWQRLHPGRDTLRSPTTHRGVSAAITDAIGHGFSPKNDHWIVDDTSYTTHYVPGKNPETLSKPDVTRRPN